MSGNESVVIKKYANRRLYNTGTSAYVTLEDLAEMVRKGEDFTVNDAKSGEDITHSVLTQIIFEQEAKTGNTLLPVSFLRQLISFYGDQMQMVVPSYLEHSMSALTEQQEKFKEQMTKSMDANPMMANMKAPMQMVEEQVKRNTEMFQQAMSMFSPFGLPNADKPEEEEKPEANDIDELKAQLKDLQGKLDNFS
ncbi:MAG: polyhydroxyalkanoate synthesis repressor PhaR [Rhizobiaceae bacterium]|nr:polyhydroxyalkanoate synthesis repressor PhaR [Rhizobiaceae bacterium]